MGPTVAIETHGCKLNQADTRRLASEFAEAGFEVVEEGQPADVHVVNTCTVTHVADRKARQALRGARRRGPEALVVATGCYAQRDPEALRRLDGIDLVVGNEGKGGLVRQVISLIDVPLVPCAVGSDMDVSSPRVLRTRAMVKIQEGCNQVCAYCIVPKVRGRERSVPPDDVVAEVRRCVDRGHKEVVLTGTQLGSYGFELPNASLTRLVERVLLETDVNRLRVSSLQPQEVGPELLGLWSDSRLCPHFHMPLQSGSDAVLQRMRRRYTADDYVRSVETIRASVPDVAITSDVVVGFPGETDEDFCRTYELCERVGFADAHVFPYSVRPGTSAAHYEGQVSSELRAERVRALLDLAREQFAQFRAKFLGDVRLVLWEAPVGGVSGATEWTGLTDNYIRVACRSPRDLTNRVAEARLGPQEGEVVRAELA